MVGSGHAGSGYMLQRGRRIAAAEGVEAVSHDGLALHASTGPPHRCGGRVRRRDGRRLVGVLQRGRRIAAAEGCRRRLPSGRSRGCFNGAAASLRRKGQGRTRAERSSPCFNGAAASLRRKGAPRLRLRPGLMVASTGPPHRCGGRRRGLAERAAYFVVLQRGRRIAAAEGATPTQTAGATSLASTGPPHRCGGRISPSSRRSKK